MGKIGGSELMGVEGVNNTMSKGGNMEEAKSNRGAALEVEECDGCTPPIGSAEASDERREASGRNVDLRNNTLDDICAVIGFSATLRLSAWFGDLGNLYIPEVAEEGQLLVKLLGMPAARKLSEEWGREHLNVPRLRGYEEDAQRRFIGNMVSLGCSTREISHMARLGERRVQQICRDLETAGLIPIVLPKKVSREAFRDKDGGFWGIRDEPGCDGV